MVVVPQETIRSDLTARQKPPSVVQGGVQSVSLSGTCCRPAEVIGDSKSLWRGAGLVGFVRSGPIAYSPFEWKL